MSIQLQEIQSIYISQNRLVEGKDYVRAEWLKVDFAQSDNERVRVINLPIQSDTFDFYIKYQGNGSCVILYTGECSYYFDNNKTRLDLWKNNKLYKSITVPNVNVKRFTSNSEAFYVDGIQIPKYGFPVLYASVNAYLSRVVISYSTIEVDGVTRYVPCQLLRNIPPTLDANNIARTAGECGMYDSVSGKFYGNIASSGSFSVEGLDESGTVEDTRLHQIYTNKLVEGKDYTLGEMLKGDDNSPYISIPNLQNFNLEAHRTTSNNYTLVVGTYTQYQGTTYTAYINYTQQINKSSANVTSGVFKATVAISNDVTIEKRYKVGYDALKFNGANCVRNAGEPVYNGIDLRTVKKLLANANSYIVSLKGNRTYANSDEWKYTFVPCKLLRSIPRNLDAQCKSRQAGECGMIDLVSGRFYGNVANSGAFSLAWDEWLKDCSIQIAIPSTCYAFNYTTRVDTTKLTSELVDFDFIKLSNTQIVYGDEDDGHVYTVDWGTNKWATLNISYNRGAVATILNGTTVGTSYNTILDQNPHIQLYDIMQIKQIDWSIMEDNIVTTTTLTRYVDETTGQQGLISNQDGTIIYAD